MISRRTLLSAAPALSLTACATSQPSVDALTGFPSAPTTSTLGQKALTKIALTSCANQAQPVPLYQTVLEAQPDLVLMLGDNVYGSDNKGDPTLPDLRAAYEKMAVAPEFRALVSQVPTEAMWDDHDFGLNDGGGDFTDKSLAQKMFNAFWNTPADSILRRQQGLYRAKMIGPVGERVQIIFLDTRTFRDPLLPTDERGARGKERYMPHPDDSTADVLGQAQWLFLERELRQPADLRLIVSSIQVIAEGHGYERWGNFPAARRRLYQLIHDTAAKGVFFVSGDRHYGSIHRTATGLAYPLVDITASAMNRPFGVRPGTTEVDEPSTTRVGPGYGPINFGMVRIDWAGRNLSLDLVGASGQNVQACPISFNELGL